MSEINKAEAIRLKEEGTTYYKEQNFLEALVSYTKAIQIDRNNASLWGNRATTYYQLGLYDKAVEDSKYAIELAPKVAKYHWRKGVSHLKLGQNYAATLAFKNGLKEDPMNPDIRRELAERRPGEPAYQGAHANLSWEQKREKALEFKDQGNKFFQQKKYGPAIDQYTQALDLDPSDSIFYNNRAACYTELGKLQEAIKDTKYAIALGHTNGTSTMGNTANATPTLIAKAYLRQAVAYEKLGQLDKALTSLESGRREEDSAAIREKLTDLKRKLAK